MFVELRIRDERDNGLASFRVNVNGYVLTSGDVCDGVNDGNDGVSFSILCQRDIVSGLQISDGSAFGFDSYDSVSVLVHLDALAGVGEHQTERMANFSVRKFVCRCVFFQNGLFFHNLSCVFVNNPRGEYDAGSRERDFKPLH